MLQAVRPGSTFIRNFPEAGKSRHPERNRNGNGVNGLAQARHVCPGLDAPHPSEADMTGQALISKIAQKIEDVSESCLLAGGNELSFRRTQIFSGLRSTQIRHDKKLS
ncbi:hypothetical protein V1T76_07515 [Roseibium sp. FZY0029]|uniref:hypothetical protein n=1 Tax=Roseibium sp. FZY0029 TaxID=3116647 RepID=UPI002EAF60D6|nr:hypothetical protein [Roseibium sp. FZY0029]